MVTLGQERVRALTFPFAFLIFMVPLPTGATHWIEYFFQHQSANASSLLFQITGTPVLRDGQLFRLPGISIMVAEECSGIRSSMVLFITCLLAGHLFLRSAWTRGVLALAVIPLGILRNAFRIFTISMLCVHVDPKMIDSPIHRRGGPVFFLISLVPLFLILWLCRRWEARKNPTGGKQEAASAIRY
jgi:exosortase C (VPDSG-CTERM-specific)